MTANLPYLSSEIAHQTAAQCCAGGLKCRASEQNDSCICVEAGIIAAEYVATLLQPIKPLLRLKGAPVEEG